MQHRAAAPQSKHDANGQKRRTSALPRGGFTLDGPKVAWDKESCAGTVLTPTPPMRPAPVRPAPTRPAPARPDPRRPDSALQTGLHRQAPGRPSQPSPRRSPRDASDLAEALPYGSHVEWRHFLRSLKDNPAAHRQNRIPHPHPPIGHPPLRPLALSPLTSPAPSPSSRPRIGHAPEGASWKDSRVLSRLQRGGGRVLLVTSALWTRRS